LCQELWQEGIALKNCITLHGLDHVVVRDEKKKQPVLCIGIYSPTTSTHVDHSVTLLWKSGKKAHPRRHATKNFHSNWNVIKEMHIEATFVAVPAASKKMIALDPPMVQEIRPAQPSVVDETCELERQKKKQ
jgi:hypothetical protein